MKKFMKQKGAHWIGMAFCVFLSYMALFNSTNSEAWRPAFFAFLPMCFFFVAVNTYEMHKEIRELRQKLTELESKKVG